MNVSQLSRELGKYSDQSESKTTVYNQPGGCDLARLDDVTNRCGVKRNTSPLTATKRSVKIIDRRGDTEKDVRNVREERGGAVSRIDDIDDIIKTEHNNASYYPSNTFSNLKGKFVGGNDFQAIKNELREANLYKRGELGRSCSRQHKIPDFMKKDDYMFGLKTLGNDERNNAKSLLRPNSKGTENHGERPEDEWVKVDAESSHDGSRRNCIKSHGSYAPGEQRKRDYVWPVDPITTVFGKKGMDVTQSLMSKGVSEALRHPVEDNGMKRHMVVKSKKNQVPWTESHVFGEKKSVTVETAAECLQFENSHDRPDDLNDDIGKGVLPGFRNAFTHHRSFGCPSIRTDIPKYDRNSVADTQNYGDDVNADYLLRPNQCSLFGVPIDEFHVKRSKPYIRTLFKDCNYIMSDDDFNLIWDCVCDDDELCSLEEFRNAYNKWREEKQKKLA